MRRDQAMYLAAGLVLGVIIGLVFGILVSRPEMVGGAPAAAGAAAGAPPAAPGPADPMTEITARINALQGRLAANPQDAEALVELGNIFLQANHAEQAAVHFDRAVQAAPANPQVLAAAAVGLQHAGQPQRAIEMAERAMRAEPNDARVAEMAFSIALRGAGDVEAAQRALDELRRRSPQHPELPAMEAELARVRGLAAVAAGGEANAATLIEAGNFFFDTQRWAEAEKAYRRALALQPGDPNVITDHGIALFHLGRHDEALDQFQQALSVSPSHWQAALNGVVVSLDRGDTGAARTWLERLRSLQPNHPSIPNFERQIGQAGAGGAG
ncbi:MAG: tetratricopeptide repeat protein [Acidobacteria bacterium]|nr:tetratricopeptide repeat protein [Acidobacteriota bacterium]